MWRLRLSWKQQKTQLGMMSGYLSQGMVDDSQTLGGAHKDHGCLFLLGALLQTVIDHLVEGTVVFPVLVEGM